MEKISFRVEGIYKIIYLSNILIVLVKPKRESLGIALKTNYPLIKDLK